MNYKLSPPRNRKEAIDMMVKIGSIKEMTEEERKMILNAWEVN
jgi:hypothetical protein